MKYLESCIDETLRKHPVVPLLTRECVKDYKLPGTDRIIEKGTKILIPAFALQRDEKYYEEPDKFIPERFNEQNSIGKNLTNPPYLPFGEGPRNCIGLRLGKMQTKVGLVLMLRKFRFELEKRLKKNEMVFDPKVSFLSPLGGIKLHIIKR
ncbi:probable cytochrome P450 6a14 [Contarinia nasturtii]|uniref:probable cytochrome P450 6a14 n=1 Tax=Contarinia nasturtii TaxID=265458 RepID=UPI0012D466FB|nr:probable cytochrome P450 6a14 [Contarinia nasturtii]